MNPRQRGRRTTDVPGPDSVAGPGPGTSSSDELPACVRCSEHVAAAGSSLCEPRIADLGEHDAAEREAGAFVLVDDDAPVLARSAGYNAAMADATAHKDRAYGEALRRLAAASGTAYNEYHQRMQAADEAFELARRAAVHAYELARAGQAPS